MALISTKKMLADAFAKNYAVGAFNFNNLEVLTAIVEAAAAERSPVILSASEGAIKYAGIENVVALARNAAAKYPEIPMALHLDHGQSAEMCAKCVDAGFSSVMIDASRLDFVENVAETKKVVEYAHARGISVEAELGKLVGIEDNVNVKSGDGAFTDADEARDFVEKTGCDSLAVAIGTSHGAYKFKGEAKLDLVRLAEISAKLPNFPLVLHGASSVPRDLVEKAEKFGAKMPSAKGVPNEILAEVSKNAICKVNTDTDLRIAFLGEIRRVFVEDPSEFDARKYLGPAKDAVFEVVRAKMRVLGSSNKII